MLGIISLDLFAVLLGGATALLPIFADEIFHIGPQGLGLLRAAPAVGALVDRVRAHATGRSRSASAASCSRAWPVSASPPSCSRCRGRSPLSLFALAVLGASDSVSVVIRMTLVQIETPDAMRGRVNAVNSLFSGTSNQLGDFRAGAMAAWLGVIPAVLVGGVGILLVVLIWTRVFPALTQVNTFYAGKG